MNITFPDGSVKQFEDGMTALQIAETISQKLKKATLAAEIDGQRADAFRPIHGDHMLKLLTWQDEDGRWTMRHTASHILAQAVKRVHPEAKLAIGPAIENGFYYDFDAEPFTPEDLEKIQKEMEKIIAEALPLERFEMPRAEAIEYFKQKEEPYKVELIEDLPEDAIISFYKQGDFVDLCAGPHVETTGKVRFVKLMSVAGAYWRGSEKNKMLQRIYGIVGKDQAEIDACLARLEEAKRRDHRVLGKELELFTITDAVGPGLAHWLPRGARVRVAIEDYWRRKHYEAGYEIVYTPHVGKSNLWETSGHLSFYKDGMFPVMKVQEGEGRDAYVQDYYVKPMNCPFHIQCYQFEKRSYRDLPIRYAELGTVYRYEKDGVRHGLFRVRGFTQDDAHIFCTPEQIVQEIKDTVEFAKKMLGKFGFHEIQAYLSTKPAKAVGDPARWEQATQSLRDALDPRMRK